MSDVICFGAILPDQVLAMPRLPAAGESSIHALGEQTYLGGEPSNVSGHLARWGMPVALAGNNFAADHRGSMLKHALDERPNTTVWMQTDPEMAWTPTCYILTTPDGERTIIASWPPAATFTLPPAAEVAAARLISVSIFGPGMDAMIDLAHAHGKPLAMADATGLNDQRLQNVAMITTSRATLDQRQHIQDISGWMEHAGTATGALIAVTDGPALVLCRTPDGRILHAQPPAIRPVDTTGAGDAFKATLIYGWLNNWPIEHSLERALRVAAAACLQRGPCPEVALEA